MLFHLSGDAPTVGINDTVINSMTYDEMVVLRAELIDAVMLGNLPKELNITYEKVY